MQLHEIAQALQEVRFKYWDEGLTQKQMFYKFREETGISGLPFDNEKEDMDFVRLDNKVVEQMKKPLQMAALKLDQAEAAAKQAVINTIYLQDPEGPEETRNLLRLSQHVRGKNEIQMHAAITEAVQKYGDDELKAQVEAVWPGLLEGE